ncbi:hypothetical protein C2S51_014082 [Perilla frutescens var. frutescens]|nr:hypothetical protein C2S51_014082 [Perilla frutescens var. frutescens]
MSQHNKSRTSNFNPTEDKHLCRVYLDVSQDGIASNNQSKERFWSRITDNYHSQRSSPHIADRTQKSLQCCMQVMLKEVKKFNGCVQQIELLNPSGANEQTILDRANEQLMMHEGYAGGFKFQHVWSILKNFVQVETVGRVPSSVEENVSTTPQDSLSDFEINLSSGGSSASKRPEGVKKSKLKRKQQEDISSAANTFKEENEKLRELLPIGYEKKDIYLEMQEKKLEAQKRRQRLDELKRDDKILLTNLDTIDDPERREYIRLEQQAIMHKRRQELQANSTFNVFGMDFPDVGGGSGGGLSDY